MPVSLGLKQTSLKMPDFFETTTIFSFQDWRLIKKHIKYEKNKFLNKFTAKIYKVSFFGQKIKQNYSQTVMKNVEIFSAKYHIDTSGE